MTGTTIAQALSISLMPFLTRMYTPADFGVFALFTAIISVLSVVVTARYELAIMLPASDEEAAHLVALSFIISIFISIFTLIIILIFKTNIVNWLGAGISKWLYLVPVSIFLTGIYQALNYWNNRKKQFKNLAFSRVCQTSSSASSQILFGYSGISGGLIWGSLFGQFSASMFLGMFSWKNIRSFYHTLSKVNLLNVAKKYKRFPAYSIWGAFLDSGASQMPVFILNKFFSTVSVGFFSLTFRVLNLPVSLVTSSLSQVLLQKIIEIHQTNPKELKAYIWKIFLILMSLCIPFILIIWLFGENIFVIAFGEAWREAGSYASLLIIAVAVRFMISPLSSVFALEHNLRLGTLWQLIYFVTITTTLYLSRNLMIQDFLKVFVLHEVVLYLLYFKFILIGSNEYSRVSN